MHLGDMLGPKSNWYDLVAIGVLAAVLVQWAFVGFLVGWVVERWQRRG
jgi:hypothetical protein